MVIEGRSQATWRQETGIDLRRLPNVRRDVQHGRPRSFYVLTKMLLMPSLWNESFGLAGRGDGQRHSGAGQQPRRPAGDDGGCRVCVRHPGLVHAPDARRADSQEAEPWVETIIRLWDDEAFYRQASEAARQRAEYWRPERIAPVYREFFGNLFPQPGPPLVPRPARDAPVFVTCPRWAGRAGWETSYSRLRP